MVGVDTREQVIHEIVGAMEPMMDAIRLNMLEGAIRGALRGLKLEEGMHGAVYRVGRHRTTDSVLLRQQEG